MSELKHCPFCGSKVELIELIEDHFSIICTNKECLIQPTTPLRCDGNSETSIKAWNQRVSQWISVDSPPDNTDNVMILVDESILTGWYRPSDKTWHLCVDDIYVYGDCCVELYEKPSYWQPLPSLPED